jgi:hypothetical protein
MRACGQGRQLLPASGSPAREEHAPAGVSIIINKGALTYLVPGASYKLQVLRIRSKAVACLSLRSSVRKLRKGVNEPRLTSQ